MVKAFINSFQSLGTVDGPGIRYVVFMQGCNLRCGCCHNPETWQENVGESYTATEVLEKILRFKEYFGSEGGVTVSGGEPLLQAEFVKELFKLCKDNGINTCLDTSGSIINQSVIELLDVTDRVLLDVKYHTNEFYEKYVGCKLDQVVKFLSLLQDKMVKTTIRQVIIPTLNESEENVEFIKNLKENYSVIEGVEFLPFKKICEVKYKKMGIPFRFSSISTPSSSLMEFVNSKLLEKQ